MNLCIFVSL